MPYIKAGLKKNSPHFSFTCPLGIAIVSIKIRNISHFAFQEARHSVTFSCQDLVPVFKYHKVLLLASPYTHLGKPFLGQCKRHRKKPL